MQPFEVVGVRDVTLVRYRLPKCSYLRGQAVATCLVEVRLVEGEG